MSFGWRRSITTEYQEPMNELKSTKQKDLSIYRELISKTSAKIEAHHEFREAFNEEMAFGFDLFKFFKVGENKVSDILAFLIDPRRNHGQGELFLQDFVDTLAATLQSESNEERRNAIDNLEKASIMLSNAKVLTEKSIDPIPDKRPGKRRIDIYIPLKSYAIAIENKIWAGDQNEQLKDYKEFLDKYHRDGNLLVYLTPFGHPPNTESIKKASWSQGVKKGQFCTLSYKHDILPMLERWEAKCKAERVRFFIREFKNHLSVKFLGGNQINMNKALKDLVLENKDTVVALCAAHQSIENELKNKIVQVGNLFKQNPVKDTKNEGPFTGNRGEYYAFKFSLEKLVNSQHESPETIKLYVHVSSKKMELRLWHYVEKYDSEPLKRAIQRWAEDVRATSEWVIDIREKEGKPLLILNSDIKPRDIAELMRQKAEMIKELEL